MEIHNGQITFGPLSGTGPRTSSTTVTFTRIPTQATAIMKGFSASFSGGNDHHLGNLDIRLSSSISGNIVTVNATFGLRDWSGNWDDNYEGMVFFSVIGE